MKKNTDRSQCNDDEAKMTMVVEKGELEPERHLAAHEADGRDEQAGPAGPFNLTVLTKSHILDQKSEL